MTSYWARMKYRSAEKMVLVTHHQDAGCGSGKQPYFSKVRQLSPWRFTALHDVPHLLNGWSK